MYKFAFGVVFWLVATSALADGKTVYESTCAACHQVTGEGLPPAFPALKGAELVNGPPEPVIQLVLQGRSGTAMVSFAHMSDEDVAAVVSYMRSSWGNTGGGVNAEQVAAQR